MIGPSGLQGFIEDVLYFDDQFSVYLVPIPLRGNKVIVGMDWLIPNGVMIDCE